MEISNLMRTAPLPRKKEPMEEDLRELSVSDRRNAIAAKQAPNADKPWLKDPGFEHLRNMAEYIAVKKDFAFLELGRIERTFHSFKNKLSETQPELAAKLFSFSLDENGGIKVLVHEGNISDAEKGWIAQSLSEYCGFGDSVNHFLGSLKLIMMHDDNGPSSTENKNTDTIGQRMNFGAVFGTMDRLLACKQHVDRTLQTLLPSIPEEV
jgi:hypothetical protein